MYGLTHAQLTGIDLVIDEAVPDNVLVNAPGDPKYIMRVNQKTLDRLKPYVDSLPAKQAFLGDAAGKPGIVRCGRCRREEERQPNGHVPEDWEVVSEPFDYEIMQGSTFYFVCGECQNV